MLNVKISFSREETRSTTEDTRFGVAEPYGRGGVEAILYYQQIDTFARSGLASRSLALAHALAHEVGHLLLWSKSHSPGGIMKAQWSRSGLKAIEQGKLAFSLEEAQSMKANLLRRQMHYQLIMASDGFVRKQGDLVSNEAAEPGMHINVCVYNLAQVSPDTLDQAEREASRIFQKAGVEVLWLDYPLSETGVEQNSPCGPPFGITDFRLRLLPSSRPEELGVRATSMGLALPCAEGEGGCVVNIFYRRAEELGKQGDLGLPKMLGHAIAHELGHELLGSNAHSPIGLMRENWGPKDLRCAAKGDMLFTHDQAKLVRDNLLAKIKSQESPAVSGNRALN